MKNSNKGLYVIASALAVILIAAIALIVVKPWAEKPSADSTTAAVTTAPATDAVPGETVSPGTTLAPPQELAPTASDSPSFWRLAAEAQYAATKGWTNGVDYVGSIEHDFTRDMVLGLEDLPASSPWVYGSDSAKVTMRVYSDFSCPMCTKMHSDVFPTLKKLADEGQVRVEWHTLIIFPNYGSDLAALGAEAAAQQDKLWEFVDAAYSTAGAGAHPEYDDAAVRAVAQKAGLDMAKFDAAYADPATKASLEASQAAVRELGFTGTPTTLMDSVYISGALPLNYFTNTIEVQNYLAMQGR